MQHETRAAVTLENAIRRHNALYRLGTPEISDKVYDKMVEDLKTISPNNSWFSQIEPGYVSSGRKCKLPIPMRSLNKVKGIDEIINWLKTSGVNTKDKVVVMPKFDGISILRDESSSKAYTRGGSENEGQDVSDHFGKLYKPVKHNEGLVYGELMFTRQAWANYFAGKKSLETGSPYKSPRNTIAGLMNRDSACDELALAYYFRYGVDDAQLDNYNSFSEVLKDLCDTYIQPHSYNIVTAGELNEQTLFAMFEEWSTLYYIDGLVLYIDNLEDWRKLGRHSGTGNPKYAMAYKHPDFTSVFETTVLGVDWRISKSGAFKPVVKIEQVNTGDCIMESPTGYNRRWIENNGIGAGAKVIVTRSGGVIPKILKPISCANPDIPKVCPYCGSTLTPISTEICCPSPECPGLMMAKMIFFFKTAGVEQVGYETYVKLYESGIDSISKMLDITFDEIVSIEGFGDGIANIILSEMKRLKTDGLPLVTYIHASDCFKGIGAIKAQNILDSFDDKTLQDFVAGKWGKHISSDSVTIRNFIAGYDSFSELISELPIKILLPQKQLPTNDKYKNWKVCFSGVRSADAESKIKDGGGSIVSGISKNTTHLIVKDKDVISSKVEKAQMLGVKILSLKEFEDCN